MTIAKAYPKARFSLASIFLSTDAFPAIFITIKEVEHESKTTSYVYYPSEFCLDGSESVSGYPSMRSGSHGILPRGQEAAAGSAGKISVPVWPSPE